MARLARLKINRRKTKRFIRAIAFRFKKSNDLFVRPAYIYRRTLRKLNVGFQTVTPYNAYQRELQWVRYKFVNVKYLELLAAMHDDISDLRVGRRKNKFARAFYKHLSVIYKFFFLYRSFFFSIYIDLFHLLKSVRTRKQRVRYFLILSFSKNKLFINLQNMKKKNYLFLSTGLFVKFFKKRKSFRKNKAVKLLMAKYLRKVYVISRIMSSVLIIRRNPIFLPEFIKQLNTPILHHYTDPVDNKPVDEIESGYDGLKFSHFVFTESRDFSNNRKPQKGRIKRKILRKLVFQNSLVD